MLKERAIKLSQSRRESYLDRPQEILTISSPKRKQKDILRQETIDTLGRMRIKTKPMSIGICMLTIILTTCPCIRLICIILLKVSKGMGKDTKGHQDSLVANVIKEDLLTATKELLLSITTLLMGILQCTILSMGFLLKKDMKGRNMGTKRKEKLSTSLPTIIQCTIPGIILPTICLLHLTLSKILTLEFKVIHLSRVQLLQEGKIRARIQIIRMLEVKTST